MKMEMRTTMVARKVAVLVVMVLAVAGMASAGAVISNVLTGHAYIRHTEQFDLSWIGMSGAPDIYDDTVNSLPVGTDTHYLNIGDWLIAGLPYGVGVNFDNPNDAGRSYDVVGVVEVTTNLHIATELSISMCVYYGSIEVLGWTEVDVDVVDVDGRVTTDPTNLWDSHVYELVVDDLGSPFTVVPGGEVTAWLMLEVEPRIVMDADIYYSEITLNAWVEVYEP